jgi:hypothetical protein
MGLSDSVVLRWMRRRRSFLIAFVAGIAALHVVDGLVGFNGWIRVVAGGAIGLVARACFPPPEQETP